MATTRKFVARFGLDNNATTIDNLGVAGASLGLAGANAVTLTSTGTTNVTLPTSGTLATTAQIPTVNDGALTLAVSGVGLTGSASFSANQSGASTFTVTSNATSANTASTIVSRDASGNFTAGTITASLTGAASLNVLKAGDTMTGDLTISRSTANAAQLMLNTSSAGLGNYVFFRVGGNSRWVLGASSAAESGSNAGSDFFIQRYTDAGVFIDVPVSIGRSTGLITFAGDIFQSRANPTITLNAAAGGQNGHIQFRTNNNSRWIIGKNSTSESGSNVGSDFAVTRYTDAGALIGDALVITRSTGNATFSGSVTATGGFSGALTGNASTATSAAALTTGRTFSVSGDATGTSGSFDGSANATIPVTLATVNSSPQTDTFRKITVNGKGLVTATSAVAGSDITTALGYTPVNRAGDTMTGNLVLNADPTVALGAATKQYVDNVASGLTVHLAARAATTANLTATYANGSAGVGATLTGTGALPAIDGVTLAVNDRVLVKNQTTQTQNGIYVVTTLSPNWVLTRASDFDNSPVGEVTGGDALFVQEGTQANTEWVQTTTGTLTIGTSNIVFTQFGGAGTISGGTGITVSSNTVSLATSNVSSLFSLATNGMIARTAANTVTARTITAGTNIAVTNGDGVSGNPTIAFSGTLPVASGGTGATTESGARTALGATTIGSNLFTLTNPSAVTFLRVNADNTASALSASDFRTAIGAGTGNGSVTSVNLTAPAAGITVSGGPVTSSGSITLALANDLSAVEGLSGTGVAVRTAADTWATRTLAVSGTGLSITNADGVSGNPTIASNATSANTASTIMARDASGNFAAGTATLGGDLIVGSAVTTANASIEIGANRTGDGAAFIDFWSAATPGDYNTRLIRSSGANGATTLTHRGTGNLSLTTEGAAGIAFSTNGSQRFAIDSAGTLTSSAGPNDRILLDGTGATNVTIRTLLDANTYVPPRFIMRRIGATTPFATPSSSTIGELRWDGFSSNGAYASFAQISAFAGTVNTAGAPSSMSFEVNDGTAQRTLMQIGVNASNIRTQVLDINNILHTSVTDNSNPGFLVMIKGRGAYGALTAVQSGDGIGTWRGDAHDGTAARQSASIAFQADGAPATSTVPGRIVFSTTPAGNSQVPIERMRIDSAGNLGIGLTPVSTSLSDLQTAGDITIATSGGQALGFNAYWDSTASSWRAQIAGFGSFIRHDSSTGALSFFSSTGAGTANGNITSVARWVMNANGQLVSQSGSGLANRILLDGNSASENPDIVLRTVLNASTYAPPRLFLRRHGVVNQATPSNTSIGEIRFDGNTSSNTYTVFGMISTEVFTNTSTGAPSSVHIEVNDGAGAQRMFSIGGTTTYRTSTFNVNQINLRAPGDNIDPPYFALLKQRGTYASPAAVQSGDFLGAVQFYGRDSTTDRIGADIVATAAAAPANSTVPGNLIFRTTPAGTSQTAVERMRIDSNGNLTINGSADFQTRYTESRTAQTAAATTTIDCSTSNNFVVTLAANITTLSFTNVPASGRVYNATLILQQDATGSRTVSWPASVRWPGATAPTLTTTANRIDVITLMTYDGGNRWVAFVAGQNFNVA